MGANDESAAVAKPEPSAARAVLSDVVAVKSNIEDAVFYIFGSDQLFEFLYDLIGHKYTTRLNTDDHSISEIHMIFQDLMTEPFDRYFQLLFVKYGLHTYFFHKSR